MATAALLVLLVLASWPSSTANAAATTNCPPTPYGSSDCYNPNATGEFDDPDWRALPTASQFNTTPLSACEPSTGGTCNVSAAETPPADPNNPEYYLNSAYWPAEKRPDIETYAIQKYGYDYHGCVTHGCFLIDAMAVGYPVSHQAVVGTLAVLCTSADADLSTAKACIPDGSADTLGYVEAVSPDGSFELSLGGCPILNSDSGLCLGSYPAGDAADFDFIGLMPASGFRDPAAEPSSVSAAGRSFLVYGEATRLTATLLDGNGAPVAGQTLALEAERHGGWRAVDSGATSAHGTVAVSVAPNATTTYRWVASGANFRPVYGGRFVVKVRIKSTAPEIEGGLKVGGVAAVLIVPWLPHEVTYRYQWYVDGRAISRATRSSLKLGRALYGRRVVVKVTGTAPGLVSATRVSKPSAKIG